MTLIGQKGKIFTRSELLDLVWGYDFVGDTRTVDTHIQRLRKNLMQETLLPQYLELAINLKSR